MALKRALILSFVPGAGYVLRASEDVSEITARRARDAGYRVVSAKEIPDAVLVSHYAKRAEAETMAATLRCEVVSYQRLTTDVWKKRWASAGRVSPPAAGEEGQ